MQRNAPCIIPDATSVRRCDAADIAENTLRAIRQWGETALYIAPDGKTFCCGAAVDIAPPASLVGVYDARATASEIRDDILAMERIH